MLVSDTRSLVWMANQNAVTLHVWPSRLPGPLHPEGLFHPDVCVFDVHMPGLTGHEVMQELRSDSSTKRIPVILATATLQERALWRLGPKPDGCLRKSGEMLQLEDRVRTVLDGRTAKELSGERVRHGTRV